MLSGYSIPFYYLADFYTISCLVGTFEKASRFDIIKDTDWMCNDFKIRENLMNLKK